jgi:nucleoid-associated protein YgaU
VEKGVSTMTSDAKIGLLLGFVFIITIGFLIDGLPDFLKSASAEESVRTSVVDYRTDSVGISGYAEKAIGEIADFKKHREIEPPVETRFRIDLANAVTPVEKPKRLFQPKPRQQAVVVTKSTERKYTVQTDDNLAVIAKKFYGPELGNKRAVVRGIFEANIDILDSPNDIRIGQKLTIPAIGSAAKPQPQKKSIFHSGMFEKVKKLVTRSKPKRHVVRQDETLWQIAAEYLGDGERYHEIFELNEDIINDTYELGIGISLRLPRR